jgi:hypothetical protein
MSDDKIQRKPVLAFDLSPKLSDQINTTGDQEEDRRLRVLKLRLRGHSQQEIADALNVSLSTIKRDCIVVKEEYSTALSEEDRKTIVLETLSGFDDLLERAWYEYESAPRGSALKLKALDLARVIKGDKLKAMQECGLVNVASEKVEHTVSFDVIKEWTDEFKHNVAKSMIENMLTKQLSPPVPEDVIEIVDAEETTDEIKDPNEV